MNIFYLSDDPQICAEQHCDKHVVKMCIEYAQLLSTAHSENVANYVWLYSLLDSLLKEYTHRYERVHAVQRRMSVLLTPPVSIGFCLNCTPMPQCMPDDCKVEHMPILAYQDFYMKHKRPFCNWTKRPRPIWFT